MGTNRQTIDVTPDKRSSISWGTWTIRLAASPRFSSPYTPCPMCFSSSSTRNPPSAPSSAPYCRHSASLSVPFSLPPWISLTQRFSADECCVVSVSVRLNVSSASTLVHNFATSPGREREPSTDGERPTSSLLDGSSSNEDFDVFCDAAPVSPLCLSVSLCCSVSASPSLSLSLARSVTHCQKTPPTRFVPHCSPTTRNREAMQFTVMTTFATNLSTEPVPAAACYNALLR